MKRTKRTILTLLLPTLVIIGLAIGSASADTSFTVSGNITSGVYGNQGQVVALKTENVGQELQGKTCTVVLDVHNNDSVREETDILVQSGGQTVTASNVEHAPGDAAPVNIGTLQLGPTVTMSVVLGADNETDATGAASVAADAVITCPDTPTTTTTPPPTTTTPRVPPAPPTDIVVIDTGRTGFTG